VRWIGWRPGSQTLSSASKDGSLRLWSRRTRKETAALYPLDGGKEWLITTPAGYFTGTPATRAYIWFRHGGRLWPAEKFRPRFERPDVVRRALAS
jgi:hypothetical protein